MRENIASIQFLRFVAATLVVLSHSSLAIQEHFSGSLSRLFLYVAHLGGSGVHIFFVISGFIMVFTSFTKTNESFSGPKFIAKRIIRIYPIYFIYSVLYLCFYHFSSGSENLSVEQFFGSIMLLPGYSSLIIGPGWTLSFEIYFYVCFSIAMSLGLLRGIIVLTVFFLAAIVLGFGVDTSRPSIHVLTNSLLIEFLLGAWIGYAVVSSVRIGNKLAIVILALAFAGFLAGGAFGYNHLPSAVMWGIPSALLVAGLVFRETNGRVPFLIKNGSFLGDSSYSLYLLHIVLIEAVILLAIYLDASIKMHLSLIGDNFGMMIVCLAITVYCIVLAHIFYHLIERRVVGRLQDLYRRKFTAVPTAL
jgi:exopolysaccharide production protein ExoZ